MSTDRASVVGSNPNLSGEQWQKLINLLGNDSTSSSNRLMGKSPTLSWIFDTGATLHATGCRECLVESYYGPICPVLLPDGAVIEAFTRGQVHLTNKLILQDVLYVPHLTCNLISVSRLLTLV